MAESETTRRNLYDRPLDEWDQMPDMRQNRLLADLRPVLVGAGVLPPAPRQPWPEHRRLLADLIERLVKTAWLVGFDDGHEVGLALGLDRHRQYQVGYDAATKDADGYRLDLLRILRVLGTGDVDTTGLLIYLAKRHETPGISDA